MFAVADGVFIDLPRSQTGDVPGAIGMRRLGSRFWIPVNAEFSPALLPDEIEGITRSKAYVVAPPGRVLQFDPHRAIDFTTWFQPREIRRRPWQPLPTLTPRAAQLEEILFEIPQLPPDEILEQGREDIGEDSPRPEGASIAATAVGGVGMALGGALVAAGNALRLRPLANLGARLIGNSMALAPRLTERILGRQNAALQSLLRDFREGKIERALRRALPFSEAGSRGGQPSSGTQLPARGQTRFSLNDLLRQTPSVGSYWLGGHDIWAALAAEYHKAAQAAVRAGDYRRAAYIYGKLLSDYRLAASALSQGGLHHDAATLYLVKLADRRSAAREFEAAGEVDRAVGLYRQVEDYVAAGDVLRRAGELEAATEEFRRAARHLVERHQDYHAAGILMKEKAARHDLALEFFQLGWQTRAVAPSGPNLLPCSQQLADIYANDSTPARLLRLGDEADELFSSPRFGLDAAVFYRRLAQLADRPNLQPVRDDLRDRALMGLGAILRHRAPYAIHAGDVVSAMMGRSGVWKSNVVRDAQIAWKSAIRPPHRTARDWVRTDVDVNPLGPGQVTAAVSARATGEVFVGFESGMIAVYDPNGKRSYRLSPPSDGAAVRALAVDPDGLLLVALHDGAAGMHLSSFLLRDRESSIRMIYESRVMPQAAIRAHPVWLTPVLGATHRSHLAHGLLVGCYCNGVLTLLHGAHLGPWGQLINHHDHDWHAGLLMSCVPEPPKGVPAAGVAVFSQQGIWFAESSRLDLRYTGIHRQVLSPSGFPAWSADVASPGTIELAGLDDDDEVWWTRLAMKDGRLTRNAQNSWMGEGRVGATTIYRPGGLAVVLDRGVAWLQASHSNLICVARNDVSLEGALACFVSLRTNELVVVLASGSIVSVPSPAMA
jgi:tetratricopeptide (TPR) repeat protein